MSLRTVDIVEKYDSGIQNVVEDFYLPVLKESINYDRIAGFFTSTSLLVSFRGLESLVKNKGKVRLIVSPRLSDDDIEIMNSYEDDIEKYIEMNFEDELQKVENGIASPIEALAWLLANDYMEIRIALVVKKKDMTLCSVN